MRQLPKFSNLDLDNFTVNLNTLLQDNLSRIEKILSQNNIFTWDNLMMPLENIDDELAKYFSPLAHLHAVVNSPKLRAAYEASLPLLSSYEAAISHNVPLYEAIKSIDQKTLNETQRKIIKDNLRDFELAGVNLSANKKKRFEEIQLRLSELGNTFENNVLDATNNFTLHVTDEARLNGIPAHTLHHAKALAEEKELPGYIFTLEAPVYIAILTYADDRSLREELYYAYVTRASDVGPNKGEFDNTLVMDEILLLRHEKANILGFHDFAQLSLTTKMAACCDEVMQFLKDLAVRAHHHAVMDVKELNKFAKDKFNVDELKPWDIAYFSEKQREQLHSISDEVLRPYFPLPKVLDGLFNIIEALFDVSFTKVENEDVWHKDVQCFELRDLDGGKVRGYIYMDLFARPHKRGGAWMDAYQGRRKLENGNLQLPIAYLTCNFTKAVLDKPALLSHEEVVTLFHEMGHCLHHLLTKVDYLSASGIHGVEWDAVELPSQFLENWAWVEDSIKKLTSHVDTGENLPPELFTKMINAKNFHSAMAMMRQLEFSLFDFRIHMEFDAKKNNFISEILAEVKKETSVVPSVEYNRFQHSFSHIFGGGYAAGYYSYKWAEVLSSDAFARFEEEGIFNKNTGLEFLKNILEVGSSKTAHDAFVAFRGRGSTVDALLRHNGIQ